MALDFKFITIAIFLAINFLILFVIKTRTTTVISLILAHLIAILFFSISIPSYAIFKEITIAVVIYSMVILFLISNHKSIHLTSDESPESKAFGFANFFKICGFLSIICAFFAFIFLIQNLESVSKSIEENKLLQSEQSAANPLALHDHPAHLLIREIYLSGRDNKKNLSANFDYLPKQNEKKLARLRDHLADNFLLKRFSEVILMIAAALALFLILSTKQKEEKE